LGKGRAALRGGGWGNKKLQKPHPEPRRVRHPTSTS
jgi:hypothetical protein